MPNGITVNPNQPDPVVLSSTLLPPPVWPLPVEDWVVLPPVPPGFPTGPFTPETEEPALLETAGRLALPPAQSRRRRGSQHDNLPATGM